MWGVHGVGLSKASAGKYRAPVRMGGKPILPLPLLRKKRFRGFEMEMKV